MLGQSANVPLILPTSLAYDAAGNLYFAESGRHVVRRLSPGGALTTVAGTGGQGLAGDGGSATAALLDSPEAVALDAAGDLLIADTHNHRIRRVDSQSGVISTLLLAKLPVALVIGPDGGLYYADAALHQVFRVEVDSGLTTVVVGTGVQGFAGDGGPATAAAIDSPGGLAFDGAGNLFVADTRNQRVRRVDAATGTISTVAGTSLSGFYGDGAGAANAGLALPRGLWVDGAGNLYIADSANHRIRRVDGPSGVITTVVGDGTQGFRGDGSVAATSSLDAPRAVTLSGGQLTLADTGNERVRQIDSAAMILTIAGQGAVTTTRSASATALSLTAPQVLTATVTAATTTPTGSVTLLDGTAAIATGSLKSGAATFSTSLLSSGSHTLTAAYGGSANLLPSTSAPLIVSTPAATPPDFTLTVNAPASVTVPAGGVATFNFTVAPAGGALASAVNLSVSGLPAGATSSFSPAFVPPPAAPSTVTLMIATPASARLMTTHEGWVVALLLPLLLLRGRKRKCGLATLLLLTGCGARVNTVAGGRTQAVSYNVTVTANATGAAGATLLHTAQVTLTVQ